MELKKPSDLLMLTVGNVVSKRNLFELIQFSKVESSPYWAGPNWRIGNTPQQGINWVGVPPDLRALVVKTRAGSYEEDGWIDASKGSYRYSFKARGGSISYTETANSVLTRQPQGLYPILLLTEQDGAWRFEGSFFVVGIGASYVILERGTPAPGMTDALESSATYHEGGRRYVTHLMAERSKAAVTASKQSTPWKCDICDELFATRYGVDYIEAHHKTPISTYESSHTIAAEDLALLCPNCHKAVHIYMRTFDWEYQQIRSKLCAGVSP